MIHSVGMEHVQVSYSSNVYGGKKAMPCSSSIRSLFCVARLASAAKHSLSTNRAHIVLLFVARAEHPLLTAMRRFVDL